MAATPFLDFSTPTSYSTPNTLWGLSRTVTELPPRSCYHYDIITAPDLAKIFQVRREILPNSSAHCSNSANLVFTKFSGSLESPCGCLTHSKNRKSVDTVPRKVGQSTPKSQISNPDISPKWGPIPPNKNHFSQGRQRYKMHESDGGANQKCSFRPTLLELHEMNFREISTIVRRPT